MSWNPFEDRSSTPWVILALLALGFIAGLEWRRLAAPPEPPLSAGTRVFDPRGLLRAGSEPPGSPDCDGLLATLARHKDDPAARAFASDFMADRWLKTTWEEIGRAPDPAAACAGLERLRASDRFSDLMSRRQDEPGFKALAKGLLREPAVAAFIRREKAARGRGPRARSPVE